MKKVEYKQIFKDSVQDVEFAKQLWIPFIIETKENRGEIANIEQVEDNLMKRINIQGMRSNMHFELFFVDNECIGIANFAINIGGIRGIIDPGYGFVMGFYIIPEMRRLGFGKMFFEHIENVLKIDGANYLYLTPDAVSGIPFWNALGFEDSKKIDPDDQMPIYIKYIG